jgi:hypothetical protein
MTINQNTIPKGYRNETTSPKRNGIYLGLVRKNYDAQRMGRLLVWVSDFGPDDPKFHIPVSYASPFAGATEVNRTVEDGKTENDSQKAYGFWATPPDVDNQVLVCFLDGDITNGYWFACLYPQNMNHMVPGIAFSESTDPKANQEFAPYGPPTVEYNKNDRANAPGMPRNSPTSRFTRESVQRPVFSALAEGLKTQGLQADPLRGISNTSARRESPSRVFGLLSPRGNSIHIDDGPVVEGEENEFIRFRTRSGTQILINETSGFIYMITKGGKSWVEISDDGIDMFTEESISMAAGKDVNIHAGGKVGIHGTEGIHLSTKTLTSFSSEDSNFVTGRDLLVETQRDIGLRANRDVASEAVRDISENAGKNILSGACGYISHNGKAILDNSGGASPAEVQRAQYLPDVTSRVPTHEPFDRGVDPQTGTDSEGNPTTTVVAADGTVEDRPLPPPENVSDDDLDWMTVNMWEEAIGEGDEGMAAVAQVVINRLQSRRSYNAVNPAWRGRPKGIILANRAFSWVQFKGVNTPVVSDGDWAGIERRAQRIMETRMKDRRWAHVRQLAEKVVNGSYTGGQGFQLVKGRRGDHYYNGRLVKPRWDFSQLRYVCDIKNHKFFCYK